MRKPPSGGFFFALLCTTVASETMIPSSPRTMRAPRFGSRAVDASLGRAANPGGPSTRFDADSALAIAPEHRSRHPNGIVVRT
jgi:hypothetical protein